MSDSLCTLCVCSCLTCRFCICVSECVHERVCVGCLISVRLEPHSALHIKTPEPITNYRLHSKKKKNPKATYSNVINSYEKKLWEVCLDTLIEIKKKKKKDELEGTQDQKVSSYGLRSQRLEKVIFQHFSANNSRLRNKLHVLMLNSPSPPTREIK